MEFKDLLKNRRLEIGATLEDVGNIVGVSKATVQRWETGEIKNVRRDKIEKLAKALQTTPAYLMGWTDEPEKPQDADLPVALHAPKGYDKLTDEERAFIDEMIKRYTENR